MSDPSELTEALDAAEDAFAHARGTPHFEPGINSSADTEPGEVQIQKGCRLLSAATTLQEEGEYHTSVLEHAFAVIERSIEGYLIAFAGAEPRDFRDHEEVYRRARSQAPLGEETIESLEALYSTRRTGHYYGTTVSTRQQAGAMLRVSRVVHSHLVGFDPRLGRFCHCRDR